MPIPKDQPVSAQVILRGPGGRVPGPSSVVTAETLPAYSPRPDAVAAADAELRRLGFATGPAVGDSLSITGPAALFESVFGAGLRADGKRGVQFAAGGGKGTYALPDERIPGRLRAWVAGVTFTPPPDFGPAGAFR